MTEATHARVIDPWAIEDASTLPGSTVDPARAVCLVAPDADALGRAIVALANSRGGEILAGVGADEAGRIIAVQPVDAVSFEVALSAAAERVDPPATHLLQQRTVPAGDGIVGVIRVRLSPSAPHLLTTDGGLYRLGRDGVRPIRSRRALDDLYARGRGERERADRLVESMVEKLSLNHYAFYSLAVIACTYEPSGESYRTAQTQEGWLAPPDDPFIAAFGLHEHEPRVGPGEIELRTPGEVNAYLRITRTGCVAAGEVQRRPYHDELDSAENLRARLGVLTSSVARVLGVATDALMLPHVFVEGVRGLRLVLDPQKRLVTGNAPQDTLRAPLSAGDAHDSTYVARLADEAVERLAPLFPPNNS